MLTVLYVFQFIITTLLILLIFMQKRQEATSLLSSNNYNSMFKGMAVPPNPFVKITIGLGVLFFLNSIFISGTLLTKAKGHNSVVEKAAEVRGEAIVPKLHHNSVAKVGVPLSHAHNEKGDVGNKKSVVAHHQAHGDSTKVVKSKKTTTKPLNTRNRVQKQ